MNPTVTVELTSGLPSGTTFSEGTYNQTFSAINNCDDESACSFTITLGNYDPTVIFVHGIEGNKNSWRLAAQWQVNNYHCQKATPYYADHTGISSNASTLQESVEIAVPAAMNAAGR